MTERATRRRSAQAVSSVEQRMYGVSTHPLKREPGLAIGVDFMCSEIHFTLR
ncbi:MAG: hypothetical protein ACLQMO_05385 [Acidobacteriaceae bacterium]